MPDCPHCGKHLDRVHRRLIERLFFADAYVCPKCRRRVFSHSAKTEVLLGFLFSRHTHCLRCGTPTVRRQYRRDRVDSVTRHPLSALFRLIGAPRYKCDACRLQYYDWRSPEPASHP